MTADGGHEERFKMRERSLCACARPCVSSVVVQREKVVDKCSCVCPGRCGGRVRKGENRKRNDAQVVGDEVNKCAG